MLSVGVFLLLSYVLSFFRVALNRKEKEEVEVEEDGQRERERERE